MSPHIHVPESAPDSVYTQPLPLLPRYRVRSRVQILSEVQDYNLKLMNVPALWKRTRGSKATCVVLDTGVPQHSDLIVAGGHSFIPGYSYDQNGHSTHVGGIIGAIADNQLGVAGIAPDASMRYCAVLGSNGNGSIEAIINGLRWAVDKAGAQVINMSLGLPAQMPRLRRLEEACAYATSQGATVVCATGNAGGDIGQPALYDCTIAVGAVNSKSEHAQFSNHGKQIDFAAGGVDVYSTYLSNGYALLSGTSMAAPAISGLVLLVLADHYAAKGVWMTRDQVYRKLQRIAFDVSAEGFDTLTGNGIPIFQDANWDALDAPSAPVPRPDAPPPVLRGDADLSPKPGDIPMPPQVPAQPGASEPGIIRPPAPPAKHDGCALMTSVAAQVAQAVVSSINAGTPALDALAEGLAAGGAMVARVQDAQARAKAAEILPDAGYVR